MTRLELIEEINCLGPWSHGYFDLGNGIIIQDSDVIQKRRLLAYKKYFSDIISLHFKKRKLTDKTLCDIGCNAGYFLFELFKKFRFREAVGFEPRKKNLAKAKFIARHFGLPANQYKLREFDVLEKFGKLQAFDIVLMPSVLHHLDNHLIALENAYKMTKDLFILDTLVLPDEFNTPDILRKLELKDDFYKGSRSRPFGVVGYKMEDNKLDGSAFRQGMVGVPTTQALKMMLEHVGFSGIRVYRDERQLKREVYFGRLHRDISAVIITAVKGKRTSGENFDLIARRIQKQEWDICVPLDIVSPLYRYMTGKMRIRDLPPIAKSIYREEISGQGALTRSGDEEYSSIIKTFQFAPLHKISFEYAKTCYHLGSFEESERVAKALVGIVNLDWRVTYKTYHLLALLSARLGNKKEALKYNKLSLRTFPSYFLALDFRKSYHLPT